LETDRCRAALSIMKTPKISSPYISRTSTQFIPRIFLRNGVMQQGGDDTPASRHGKAGVKFRGAASFLRQWKTPVGRGRRAAPTCRQRREM
jgi:hypothetical protein